MKKIICIVLSLMMCFSIVGCGENDDAKNIEGKYFHVKNVNQYIELTIDEKNKKVYFEGDIRADRPENMGEWKIKDNKIILKGDINNDDIILYNNYLINTKFTFKGEISNNIKFNAIFEYKNDKYIFNDNGEVFFESSDVLENKKGKYERENDIIYVNFKETNEKYKMIIYNGGINGAVYYKKEQ